MRIGHTFCAALSAVAVSAWVSGGAYEAETASLTGVEAVADARASGGSVTLFAFSAGQQLSEHTAPFDALVQVVDGRLEVTVGGTPASVAAGQVVLMPAHVPHAVKADVASRMLLVMLRDE